MEAHEAWSTKQIQKNSEMTPASDPPEDSKTSFCSEHTFTAMASSSQSQAHDDKQSISPEDRLQITADGDSLVSETVNIHGKLPNRIFTLIPPTIMSVLLAAGADRSTFFICRKFAVVEAYYARTRMIHEFDGAVIAEHDGRLFSSGLNVDGACGVGSTALRLPGAHWIRLPPVVAVYYGHRSWFARTTLGLFAWGANPVGKLGIDSPLDTAPSPRPVAIPTCVSRSVSRVDTFDSTTFIQTPEGWLAAGYNQFGQLGRPDPTAAHRPVPVPGSGDVTRFYSCWTTTFAWTPGALLGCGATYSHTLPVRDDTTLTVARLTPLLVPDPVESVVTGHGSTFFFGDGRVLAVGTNEGGRLGLLTMGGFDECVTPFRVPVSAHDVTTVLGTTLFAPSTGAVYCGHPGPAFPAPLGDTPHPLMPLPLPPGTVAVGLGEGLALARAADGVWYARGANPDGRLGVGSVAQIIPDWQAVCLEDVQHVAPCPPDGLTFITRSGLFVAGKVGRHASRTPRHVKEWTGGATIRMMAVGCD